MPPQAPRRSLISNINSPYPTQNRSIVNRAQTPGPDREPLRSEIPLFPRATRIPRSTTYTPSTPLSQQRQRQRQVPLSQHIASTLYSSSSHRKTSQTSSSSTSCSSSTTSTLVGRSSAVPLASYPPFSSSKTLHVTKRFLSDLSSPPKPMESYEQQLRLARKEKQKQQYVGDVQERPTDTSTADMNDEDSEETPKGPSHINLGPSKPRLPRAKTTGDLFGAATGRESRMSIVEEPDMRAGFESVSSSRGNESDVEDSPSKAEGKRGGALTKKKSTLSLTALRVMRQRRSTGGSKKPKPLPEPSMNIKQIHEAQNSAYWSGRFTALYDRFCAEELLMPLDTDESRRKAARESKEKGKEKKRDDRAQSIQDRRIRRVFTHLTSLCATDEAKESLRRYQSEYSRVNCCPAALPSKDLSERLGFVWNRVKGN